MWVKGEYFDDFDIAEIAAREQLDRAAQPILFDRISWFRGIWESLMPDATPLIVRAVSGKAQAWLFLVRNEDGSVQALAAPQSLRFRPIFVDAAPAMRFALLVAMARRLRLSLRLERVELGPLSANDGTAHLVERAFARAGWVMRRSPGPASRTGSADFDGPTPGSNPDIEILTSFDTLSWIAFAELLGENPRTALLQWLAETEGAAGTLRLGLLRDGAKCRAAQLWTAENGVGLLHHAVAIHADEGRLLGNVLRAHMAGDDQVACFEASELLGATLPNWLEAVEPTRNLLALNPSRLRSLPAIVSARIENLVRHPGLD